MYVSQPWSPKYYKTCLSSALSRISSVIVSVTCCLSFSVNKRNPATAAAAVLEKVTLRWDSSQSFQGGFGKATFKATALCLCLILQPRSSRCSGVRSLRMQSTGGSDVWGTWKCIALKFRAKWSRLTCNFKWGGFEEEHPAAVYFAGTKNNFEQVECSAFGYERMMLITTIRSLGCHQGEFRRLLVLDVMEINVSWPRINLVWYLGVSVLPSWQSEIYLLLCTFTASKEGFFFVVFFQLKIIQTSSCNNIASISACELIGSRYFECYRESKCSKATENANHVICRGSSRGREKSSYHASLTWFNKRKVWDLKWTLKKRKDKKKKQEGTHGRKRHLIGCKRQILLALRTRILKRCTLCRDVSASNYSL